ncbi:MAG TPA: type II toxin-antitoxin system prevent-host-death family antitoxin [Gaiellaceae bacterium]|nr:type II toxin-antitoxin system prevent-host-death family antitoxin [Gaiellaceae bacterium]
MHVGVRELKARLSEYLDRAAAGETIVVTDRGRPKAELRPLSLEARAAQLEREGRVTPPRRPGAPELPKRRFRAQATLAEILAEDRGE